MSPEAMALLCTAGPADQTGRLRGWLSTVASWPSLLELAWRSGAQPVFEARVLTEAADLVPDDVLASLERSRRINELRLSYLHRRLRDAVDVLAGENIDVLLLKGAATAYTAHNSPTERPMSDIDLLVSPERARRAYDALLGNGWSAKYSPEYKGLYEGMHHLPPLIDARAPLEVEIEIHTDIVSPLRDPFGLGADELWADADTLPGFAGNCLVPNAVHRLLHCAIHFAWSHLMREGAWKTFRDVTAITAADDLDWPTVVDAARRTRSASCCYWSLRLARDYCGSAVPRGPLRELRPGRRADWLSTALANDMVPGQRVCPSTWVSQRLWEAAIRPGTSGHGSKRPWSSHPRWDLPRPETERAPEAQRNLAGWLRFMRSFAGPPPR